MQRRIVLCDIDHTLADAYWRDGMIGTDTWDKYHSASIDDEPLHDVVALVNALSSVYSIACLTARPEKWRKLTMEWLLRHSLQIDELLMRPDDDYSGAAESKRKLIAGREHEIAFVLEDREDVAAMFKGLNITVLQVSARRQ